MIAKVTKMIMRVAVDNREIGAVVKFCAAQPINETSILILSISGTSISLLTSWKIQGVFIVYSVDRRMW